MSIIFLKRHYTLVKKKYRRCFVHQRGTLARNILGQYTYKNTER